MFEAHYADVTHITFISVCDITDLDDDKTNTLISTMWYALFLNGYKAYIKTSVV